MTIISLMSCTGAPGVTTSGMATAAALTLTELDEVVLVEAATSGGVIASQYDLPAEPGLTSLMLTIGSDNPDLLRHAQEVPGGLPVVVAPPSSSKSMTLLEARGPQLAEYLQDLSATVLVDCGRVAVGSPVVSILEKSSLVGIVVRPTRENFRLAATTLSEISEQTTTSIPAGWIIVGPSPWPNEEVVSQYGLPVLANITEDRTGAEAVAGLRKMRRRSPLARSAQTLADDLVKHLRLTQTEAPLNYMNGADPESPSGNGSGPDSSATVDKPAENADSADSESGPTQPTTVEEQQRSAGGRFIGSIDDPAKPATTPDETQPPPPSSESPKSAGPSNGANPSSNGSDAPSKKPSRAKRGKAKTR